MGSSQSTTLNSVTNILSQNISNVVTQQTENTSSDSSATNNLQVVFGPNSEVSGCDLTLKQSITVNQSVMALSKYRTTTEIANLMQQSLDQTMSQNQEAVSNFLSTTFGNQESRSNIHNTLSQLISNNVTDENTQRIIGMVSGLNTGIITIDGKYSCGPNGQINLSQTVIIEQFVKAVTELMAQVLMTNTQIADVVDKLTQDQVAKNTGIGEAISKVFSSLALFILMPLLIIFLLFGGISKLSSIGKGIGGKGIGGKGVGSIMDEAKVMKFCRGY